MIALAKFSLISLWRGIGSTAIPLVYMSCPAPFLFKYQPFLSRIFIKSVRFVCTTYSTYIIRLLCVFVKAGNKIFLSAVIVFNAKIFPANSG